MVALAGLAPDGYRDVATIAQMTGSPRNYQGKLLLMLSRRGLVESRKGLGGGFRLTRPAEVITLYDVMAAIEDIGRWTQCAFANGACSEETPCMVHSRWSRAREAFLSFLRDTTIAELAANRPSTSASAIFTDQLRVIAERS